MEFRSYIPSDSSAIEALYISVFTQSESKSEGVMVGNLSKELMTRTDKQDLYGFVALEKEDIIGSILLSRLTFEEDIEAFILSPVAIHSDHQGIGIGQRLINYSLKALKRKGVEIVITYGDPAFYTKVGFHPLSEALVKAPFELSQPEGWLGQSLIGDSIETALGRCSCVKALDNPAYW